MGRRLGYPTANIAVEEDCAVRDGVYAAFVDLEGKRYGAMVNFGVRPTFGVAQRQVLEIHVFDFEGDLYGRELTVELGEFIRSEQKFPTPEALRQQLTRDEKEIREILNIRPAPRTSGRDATDNDTRHEF
jgi:FAD synthase